ncbi:MAG: hypothetical protein VB858_12340, partial [Planctomycetaceae bacterium]
MRSSTTAFPLIRQAAGRDGCLTNSPVSTTFFTASTVYLGRAPRPLPESTFQGLCFRPIDKAIAVGVHP